MHLGFSRCSTMIGALWPRPRRTLCCISHWIPPSFKPISWEDVTSVSFQAETHSTPLAKHLAKCETRSFVVFREMKGFGLWPSTRTWLGIRQNTTRAQYEATQDSRGHIPGLLSLQFTPSAACRATPLQYGIRATVLFIDHE